MAKGNRAACMDVTYPHEGGYSDHPDDPGGATKWGITIGTLSEWRRYPVTKADVRALAKDEATAIYAARYWKPLGCEDLPYGVDCSTNDYGINSGIGRAARALQGVLGVPVDGKVGPETIKAAILANGKATIQKLCGQRLGFVQSLKTFSTFGRGWTRRIADVEAKSVAMYLARGGALSTPARKELAQEGKKAGKAANAQNSSAGGAAVGGGGVSVGDAATSAEPNWLLIAGIVTVVALLVVALVARARHNKDRSIAYARESASAL